MLLFFIIYVILILKDKDIYTFSKALKGAEEMAQRLGELPG